MDATSQKGSRRGGDLLSFDSEKKACSKQAARSMLVAVAKAGSQGDAASREGEEDGGRRGQLEPPRLHRSLDLFEMEKGQRIHHGRGGRCHRKMRRGAIDDSREGCRGGDSCCNWGDR
ncbi:hypothetical protein GW17_00053695 [Ensete ventricosum]|nr:hypothetical protein GW17_00053695 [Ensete ventricosum]